MPAPILISPILDQRVNENQSLPLAFPTNLNDYFSGATSFTITGFPSNFGEPRGFLFRGTTFPFRGVSTTDTTSAIGIISGLPQGGFTASAGPLPSPSAYNVTVTAKNSSGSVSDTFKVDILKDTKGNSSILGLPAFDNYINGRNGNDTIRGNTGNDYLNGDTENDLLVGSSGADTLLGDNGNDKLQGGTGNDSLLGGVGNDSLTADAGNDFLDGDAGLDTLDGGDGDDNLFGGTENDSMLGGNGNDVLNGGSGVDILKGRNDNDTLTGDEGNDNLFGDAGNDSLIGGKGNDNLQGSSGNDILIGANPLEANPGNGERDALTGGSGSDVFVIGDDISGFNRVFYDNQGTNDYGLITDFSQSLDTIQLSGSSADFTLGSVSIPAPGTGIFLNSDLVAIVQGDITGLNLNASYFTYV
ncbi:MAG: hypothetical protein DSM107014_15620 [Gomphosphaeria aponina SAG 52.96 = DSM 107014]|uniref:Calcium-binding protein n=1 Tax=Gomphosphaeria aponina SAG 52.96 = DSM 107014 TaxID=1521640 RepID=A0A941JT02_9CHRO|nr:hypothetical protein [Gomphosphaeria aponina SAG 52.96 = DSM 107014]